MRISPAWLREFVEIKAGDRTLANELTHAGIAVESVHGEGGNVVYEMDLTTNRVDAMNHYGVARECSSIYNLDLKPIQPKLPAAKGKAVQIVDPAKTDTERLYRARLVNFTKPEATSVCKALHKRHMNCSVVAPLADKLARS